MHCPGINSIIGFSKHGWRILSTFVFRCTLCRTGIVNISHAFHSPCLHSKGPRIFVSFSLSSVDWRINEEEEWKVVKWNQMLSTHHAATTLLVDHNWMQRMCCDGFHKMNFRANSIGYGNYFYYPQSTITSNRTDSRFCNPPVRSLDCLLISQVGKWVAPSWLVEHRNKNCRRPKWSSRFHYNSMPGRHSSVALSGLSRSNFKVQQSRIRSSTSDRLQKRVSGRCLKDQPIRIEAHTILQETPFLNYESLWRRTRKISQTTQVRPSLFTFALN